MPDHITVTPAPGSWIIRCGDTEIGRSSAVLSLTEGSYPPALYVPRADVDMTRLQKTDRTTRCPHKGMCSYYSVQVGDDPVANAVWSYEDPISGMEAIAGHLSFYTDRGCTVRQP